MKKRLATIVLSFVLGAWTISGIPVLMVEAATTQEIAVQEESTEQGLSTKNNQIASANSTKENSSEEVLPIPYLPVDVKTDYHAIFVTGIITLLSAMIGAFLAICFTNRKDEKRSALILYCDLLSIEDYLKNEKPDTNLRYSEVWQSAMADCRFFSNDDIRWIYSFYDEVYDYNFKYKNESNKDGGIDLPSNDKMKGKMLKDGKHTKEYEDILQKLRKKVNDRII